MIRACCPAYAGNGSQWPCMGRELLDSSAVFRAAIDACARVLDPLGVHLLEEFRAADGWKQPKHAMVGLTALQVGLVDMLREEYGVVPAGCLGHSSGERPKGRCQANPLNPLAAAAADLTPCCDSSDALHWKVP